MSSEFQVNPEDQFRTYRNIDHMIMQHLKIQTDNNTTSDYSTQVNMDQENLQFQSNTEKKKNKKKQYKRKKKQKKKQEEESAKTRLSKIISQIYYQETSFDESKEIIQDNLNQLVGGQKFHMFLNDTIKMHVKNMQKDIWDFMQQIMKQNTLDSSQNQEFYLQMIQHIYNKYHKLKHSSLEIQKIINMFMCINSHSNIHQNDHYQLDKSTFKFMIQSDETIKNLIKLCYSKIFPQYTEHVRKIRELAQMITKFDLSYNEYQDQYVTQKSTSVDQQQQESLGKKKKRRKFKQIDFQTNPQVVCKRLCQMVINQDKRLSCQASQQWASRLKQKYLEKPRNHDSYQWAR